jgi:cation:H+ antiporter
LDIEPAEMPKIKNQKSKIKNPNYSLPKNITLIILGLAGVLLGGEFVVRGGVQVAEIMGFSHTLIGLTIVSIGTSLPELTTGIVAITKGKDDMAVGNIVGSGVFNILFILGAAAVITPITLSANILVDVIALIAITVFLFFAARSKGQISRGEGVFLLMVYIAYLVFIIHRG